jgi:hypothetical protein
MGPEIPKRGPNTSTVPVVCATLGFFFFSFGAIQMISCRDWWPWTKPGYITMTRRQSKSQWSGACRLTLFHKIPSAKIRWKISRLDFFGIKTASSSLIIFQRDKLSTQIMNNLCWYN